VVADFLCRKTLVSSALSQVRAQISTHSDGNFGLDINHWYALGDALAGHPQRPEHLDVLRQLTELVEQGQLMFPLSAVHYMELSENPRDHQREKAANVMAKLSRFNTLRSTGKIVDEELALALNKRFGRPAFLVKVEKFGVGAWFAALEKRFSPALTAADLMGLPAHEVAVRPCVKGQTRPPTTGVTRPLPGPIRDPVTLAEHSRRRYGVPRVDVEATLKARIETSGTTRIGRTRRGGSS